MATPEDAGLPDLYEDCVKCSGTGTWKHSEKTGNGITFYNGPCPDCESIGAIPSAEGRRILDLVSRWRRMGRL